MHQSNTNLWGRVNVWVTLLSWRVIVALVSACLATFSHAYTVKPVDGGWGINGEEVLAVGRGFNLETSNNTVIVTFYGYDASRSATFYVGGGTLGANNVAQVTLSEPRNGPCFGCAITSGSIAGSPGTITLEFTSSTTGFVSIPGEGRKAISKANMTWSTTAQDLYGVWLFNFFTAPGSAGAVTAENIVLRQALAPTADGNGIATDASGRFACEQKIRGNIAGLTFCVGLNAANVIDRRMLFKRFGSQMDGDWGGAAPATLDKPVFARRWFFLNSDLPTLSSDDTAAKNLQSPDPKILAKLRAAIEDAVLEHTASQSLK